MRSLLYLLFVMIFFQSCRPEFSGQITDENGKGVAVTIELNSIGLEKGKLDKQTYKTDKDGNFRIKVDRAGKYVLNVEQENFALMSKVYYSPSQKLALRLVPAYVEEVPLDREIKVTDRRQNTAPAIDSAKIQFANSIAHIPFVYENGRLSGFEMPEQLKKAYTIMANGSTVSGTSLTIPAGSLVNKSGQIASGKVKVNISTINLLSDQMPGDFSVRMPGGVGYMISNGAASVEFYQNGERLSLRGKARVSIPIDPSVLAYGDTIFSDTIPFLSYDKDLGEWYREGTARLNRETMSYEKDVEHFSAVNFDFLKKDWACVKINPNIGAGAFSVTAIVPGQSPRNRPYSNPGACSSPDQNTHALLRLPPNTPIGIILTQGGSVVGNVVQYTGNFIPGSTTAVLPCGSSPAYAPCASTPDVFPPPPDVKPAVIVKIVPGVTAVVPSSPQVYNSTLTSVTLAWVFNFSTLTNRRYTVERKNNGETAFSQEASINLTTPQSVLQELVTNKDGFTSTEYIIRVYDTTATPVLIAESDVIIVNWP